MLNKHIIQNCLERGICASFFVKLLPRVFVYLCNNHLIRILNANIDMYQRASIPLVRIDTVTDIFQILNVLDIPRKRHIIIIIRVLKTY